MGAGTGGPRECERGCPGEGTDCCGSGQAEMARYKWACQAAVLPGGQRAPREAGEQGVAGSCGALSPGLCFGYGNLFSLWMPHSLVSSGWGPPPSKTSHRSHLPSRLCPTQTHAGLEETRFYSVGFSFCIYRFGFVRHRRLGEAPSVEPRWGSEKGHWKGLWAQRLGVEAAGKADCAQNGEAPDPGHTAPF